MRILRSAATCQSNAHIIVITKRRSILLFPSESGNLCRKKKGLLKPWTNCNGSRDINLYISLTINS